MFSFRPLNKNKKIKHQADQNHQCVKRSRCLWMINIRPKLCMSRVQISGLNTCRGGLSDSLNTAGLAAKRH